MVLRSRLQDVPRGRYEGPVRLLFRTVRLDHALRLLPEEFHRELRARAGFGFVAYEEVCHWLPEERLHRVFAASGRVDGRPATDFVYRLLSNREVGEVWGADAGRVRALVRESWDCQGQDAALDRRSGPRRGGTGSGRGSGLGTGSASLRASPSRFAAVGQ